jgi:hypothetical protein
MKKRKKKGKQKDATGKPLVVAVSIDANGAVQVYPDCLTVTEEDQRIRWRLDPESSKKWRLVGLCWCGDDEPPTGEFRDWLKEKDRISATDRNEIAGEWRYGLLYRDKKEKNSAPPRVFDPAIRNQPPH